MDPNRDFPYSREDNECLRSSTGRLFNAIMRANLIQVVVTFHGGMVAIGYEWGKCEVSHACLYSASAFAATLCVCVVTQMQCSLSGAGALLSLS